MREGVKKNISEKNIEKVNERDEIKKTLDTFLEKLKNTFFHNALPKSNARVHPKDRKKHSGLILFKCPVT